MPPTTIVETGARNMLSSLGSAYHQVCICVCGLVTTVVGFLQRNTTRLMMLLDVNQPAISFDQVQQIGLAVSPPERTLSSDTSTSCSSTLDSDLSDQEPEEEEEPEDWWTSTLRRLGENDPTFTELELDASGISEAQQQHQQQQQQQRNDNDDYDVSLQAEEVQTITKALEDNTSVTSLTLRNLTVTSPSHIVELVKALPQLKSLHLEDTRGVGLETVAKMLAFPSDSIIPQQQPLVVTAADLTAPPPPPLLSNLRELRLNHSPITLHVAKILSQAFASSQSCRQLQRLDFQGSRLEDISMGYLCKSLINHPSLTYWCLDFNSFGDLGMQALGYLLQNNPKKLREVHLFGNSITDVGATYLARALPRNTNLKSLVLSLNDMGDRGVAALAQALTINVGLQKLWMPSNNVGNRGLEAVAHHLPNWKGLEELNLGDSFDNGAAQAILNALQYNYVLRKLYLESPVYDCEYTDNRIDFYLRLNQCGRKHWFREDGSFASPALWAHALAKCHAYTDVRGSPDVLCYLLQHRPTLCQQPSPIQD